MTYCTKRNTADSFSGMESIGRSVFIGYTIGTIMAASATMPKKAMPTEPKTPYACSCTMQTRSELSEFMMKHSEASFRPIWDDPAEDIWDTL